ncbi:MAG: tyrosine-protein phosphatase [Pseudomonadota bacterium]
MQQRVHPMKGVRNFRDFGGYDTEDGRKVQTGRLFRSGHFNMAEDSDLEAINALNIRIQVDLRRPDERERMPGRWSGEHLITHDGGREQEAPHQRFLQQAAATGEGAHQWMHDYYTKAPFKPHHISMFRDWFDGLAKLGSDEGGLVNCAAGKDRTGILCGLTLTTLGVSEETILDDYELTNVAANVDERLTEATTYYNNLLGKSYSEDVYRPFVGVHRDFLMTAWSTIRDQHGSIESYLTDVIGLDDMKREALQAKYLAD